MAGSNHQNGIMSRGVPITSSGVNNYHGWWDKKIWFVDGDVGSDGNTGKGMKKSQTLKSIGKAISQAGPYDTIYVKPRVPQSDASDPEVYAEELVIPYAKNHLSIIGSVHGHDTFYGPKLKLGTADAVVDVYAPAFILENFTVHRRSSNTKAIYLRGITGYATMAGSVASHISNCMIRYASTNGIYVEWGYHSNINNCTFWGGINDVHLNGSGVPQRGMKVINCWFGSANGTVTAGPNIRLQGASTEVEIDGCNFDYLPSGNIFIQATGVVDGLIADCDFAQTTGTTNADAASGEIQLGSGTLSLTNCHGGDGALIVQS